MSEKVKYLIKNIGIFTLASFGTKILSFLAVPLYTYILSPEEYANIDIIILLTQLVTPILSVSIADAVIRFGMDHSYSKKQIFTIGLLTIIISGLLLGITMPLWRLIPAVPGRERYIVLLYLTGLFSTVLSYFIRALDKLHVVVVNSVLTAAANLILSYSFITILRMGEFGYYWAMILSNMIGCLYMGIAIKFWRYVALEENVWKTFKEMIRYSLPLSPNAICWWVNSSINRFFLYDNVSKTDLGLYSASTKIPNILTLFTSTFQQAWTLSSIDAYESETNAVFSGKKQFFQSVYRIYDLLLVVTTFFLICFARIFAALLLKGEFFMGWIYIPFLGLSFYFNSLNAFAGSILTALKLTKTIFTTTFLAAVANICGAMLIIPIYGPHGAAVSMCIGYFLMWLFRLYVLKKHDCFSVDWLYSVTNYIMLICACLVIISVDKPFVPLLLVFTVLVINTRKSLCLVFEMLKKRSVFRES